jgi:hypothetical protein
MKKKTCFIHPSSFILHPLLRRTRPPRAAIGRRRRQSRKTITQKQHLPPSRRPKSRVAGSDRSFLAAPRDHRQKSILPNMHDQPILLDVVPIAFAVLLRLHRFRPWSGMSAVLRRGINDTIAGSVHCPSCWASGFSRSQNGPPPASRCLTASRFSAALQPSSYSAPHIDSIRTRVARRRASVNPQAGATLRPALTLGWHGSTTLFSPQNRRVH